MSLNEDQTAALEAVKRGKNIFLTGPAGSGKSFLIQRIVEWSTATGLAIAVTALTGCAALLLGSGAKTLHSWAGVGLARESADVLAANILKRPQHKRKWKKTQILIVDEISMMTPEFFEKLDVIGKKVRGNSKPWGGLQLILCGDYFQLPPVTRGISGESIGRFAFESKAWKASGLTPVVLNKIERQTDAQFQTLLNECRIGNPSPASVALLKTRMGLDWKKHVIRPTLLFSKNADVDAINEKNIAALKKPLHMFDARTTVERPPDDPDLEIPTGAILEKVEQKLDNDANYASHLELCVGAQVMLLVNKDVAKGLVNGSRGVIIDFRGDGVPIVQFLHGDPVAIERQRWTSHECAAVHREQIPLRVAYAITIHKSQGATLDCALIDIGSSTFEYGQAYVAMSRVRSLESLYIHTLDPSKFMAHPTVTAFYEHLMEDAAAAEAIEHVADVASGAATFGNELADPAWRTVVQRWASSEIGRSCLAHVAERRLTAKVYPEPTDVLAALSVPLHDVQVVILGQDPYHGAGQAHGLSFSVQAGVPLPPSLKNIRKELVADLGLGEAVWPHAQGCLSQWSRRGVLLLNSVLTVEESNPNSHAGIGWETLTKQLLEAVLEARKDKPVILVGWGKSAQTILYKLPLTSKHAIVAGVHPSPLSAHTGFFGSKPFSKVNSLLEAQGAAPIAWALSADDTEDPTTAA